MARQLRPTKASTANVEAMAAPITIDGEARTRWAPAPRPVSDDYRWYGDGLPYAVRRWGAGTTFWWVTARPGEAATQGAILVAEAADGRTAVIPVPSGWEGRWARYVPATGYALAA